MVSLFDTTTINGMTLANRFIRSATGEGLADSDGAVTSKLLNFIEKQAQGGPALIVSGYAYVAKSGQAYTIQQGIHNDSLIPRARVAKIV